MPSCRLTIQYLADLTASGCRHFAGSELAGNGVAACVSRCCRARAPSGYLSFNSHY